MTVLPIMVTFLTYSFFSIFILILNERVDNNCDTEIDEGVLSIFYLDQDGDVYGDPAKEIEACSASEGYVENNKDQFPEDPNKVDGSDSDKDRVDDLVDNCPDIYNPNQFDICSFSKTLEVGPDENINDVINNNEEEEHLLILLTGNTYNISTPINIINRNISIMPKENDQEVTLINDELSSTYMIKIDLNDGLENNFVNISNLKIDCDLDIAAIELKAGQSDHITFSELTILKGKADYPRRYGAGISLFAYEDSLVNIVNNTFAENSIERATYGAIFLWTEDNSVINVNANTFLSNSNILFASILKAGAFDSSKINITNNRFQDNTGDGMEIVVCPADNSKLKIINNTLSGNNDLATGVHLNYIGDDRTGTVELINNIIANYVVRGIQIYSDVKGPLLIKNNGFFNNNNCHINKPSCIDDEELQDFIDFGDGNIVCDPDFDADLRISENSECGDVGINSVLNDPDIGNFVRFDKEGNERAVNGNIIDLGAYEVQ